MHTDEVKTLTTHRGPLLQVFARKFPTSWRDLQTCWDSLRAPHLFSSHVDGGSRASAGESAERLKQGRAPQYVPGSERCIRPHYAKSTTSILYIHCLPAQDMLFSAPCFIRLPFCAILPNAFPMLVTTHTGGSAVLDLLKALWNICIGYNGCVLLAFASMILNSFGGRGPFFFFWKTW